MTSLGLKEMIYFTETRGIQRVQKDLRETQKVFKHSEAIRLMGHLNPFIFKASQW